MAEMAPLSIGLLGGPPSLRRGSFGDGAISLWAKRPQGPVQVEKSQPCSGEKPAVVTTTIALPTNSRLSTKAAASGFGNGGRKTVNGRGHRLIGGRPATHFATAVDLGLPELSCT